MRRRSFGSVGTRLLPGSLVAGALLADAGGVHGLAFWLVLLALPAAAGDAFVGISDALEGRKAWLRAWTGTLATLMLVVGSAVREGAPQGNTPVLAVSAALGAIVLYALPTLIWVLEPLVPRSAARTAAPTPRASRA